VASTPEALILASASAARAKLLADAGIAAVGEASGVDEAPIKASFRARGGSAFDCAMALAEAKALAVVRRHPGGLVVGADQILVCEEVWFDKAADMAAVRHQLAALRGRTHVLETACCLARDGHVRWRGASRPQLRMHDFSDEFLAAYLAAEGEAVVGSLGGYRLEGRGVQLLARIEGDHFAILGLPLVELLGALREFGALPA
jgi:nucleoside triphosphate pyrophosphatase